MRAPNGFGGISKLTGNRRRPWSARVTVGWEGKKQLVKPIGYYASRQEAMIALAEYNKNPIDLNAREVTMADLFNDWKNSAHGLNAGTLRNITVGFGHCADLHNVHYYKIHYRDMQNCLDRYNTHGAKAQIKFMFMHLDKYAYGLDIIQKRYSDVLRVGAHERQKEKTIFTTDEIRRLWDNIDTPWVDSALILLYSGWRASELLGLKRSDINLDAGTMKGGVKTKAGKGRIVPIHSAILPLVKRRLEMMGPDAEYLFCHNGHQIVYERYKMKFYSLMKKIGAKHTIHETRHTFRTELDRVDANIVCVDKIMGHKNKDTGLGVYVQKSIDEMRKAIELITYSLKEGVGND
jgi:integrase